MKSLRLCRALLITACAPAAGWAIPTSRLTCAIALLALAATTRALPVPWPNPSGCIPGVFCWSNGQSDNGLFGSPQISAEGFFFPTPNFRATSSNGTPSTVADRMSFQLDIAPGNPAGITGITVSPLGGDYSIAGGGQVSAESFLMLTNIDLPVGPGNPLTEQASTIPSFPLIVAPPNNLAGLWSATQVQATPSAWRRITVVLNLVLQAATPVGGSATIGQAPGGVLVRFDVPEPGGAALAIGATVVLARRRRGTASGEKRCPRQRFPELSRRRRGL